MLLKKLYYRYKSLLPKIANFIAKLHDGKWFFKTFPIWFMSLLFFLFLPISNFPSFKYNLTNLQLLGLIFIPSQDTAETTYNLKVKDCQALLLSHAIAPYDVEKAKKVLVTAKNCENQDDLNHWAGELEYRQGNLNAAKKYWREIKVNSIITWGASEYYSGNIDKAKNILEILLSTEYPIVLSSEQESFLFSLLAKIYQDKGDIQKSLGYSKIAWEEGSKPYDLAYQLGTQYFLTGQFIDAVNVLEIGLQHKISGKFYSQLDFSYYSRLVECYISIGDTQKAWHYYHIAKETIDKERQNAGAPEILEMQQNRLNSLKLSLESTP